MSTDRAQVIADLADLVLTIARKLNAQEIDDPAFVQLSPLERVVMHCIDQHPGIGPSEIGAALGLRSGNASAALRALEAKGFIRRAPDPQDGRAVRVFPTQKAAHNLERVRAAWVRTLSPVVPAEADLAEVVDLLGRIDADFHARPAG